MSLWKRVVISFIVGLIVTIGVALIAAQTATSSVGGGYVKTSTGDGDYVAVWDIEVRENPAHRRLRYWRMQVSGMNLMISTADYEARKLDLEPFPGHLKPREVSDLEIYALFGECGWPLPAMSYMVDQTWESSAPTWKANWTLVLGERPNGNPQVLPLRPVWWGLLVDTLAFGLVVLGAWEGVRRAVHWRRSRVGRCRGCGYDLSGVDGICPECGREP